MTAPPPDPPPKQVITGSHDTTIRLWDLRKGATQATLTYHKKVRSPAKHPTFHTPRGWNTCLHEHLKGPGGAYGTGEGGGALPWCA